MFPQGIKNLDVLCPLKIGKNHILEFRVFIKVFKVKFKEGETKLNAVTHDKKIMNKAKNFN